MAKTSFILNDETKVNSNGYRVPNNQIDLVRFEANAVLLYMHKRGEVHGRWENLRIEGPLLLADPVFDVDDPESKKIAGKVERGFLKGASLYLAFTPNTRFVEAADGTPELHGVEAFEGSIVDIPSNSESLKLFAGEKELSSEEIKGIMLSASSNPETPASKTKTKIEMEKIKLSAAALMVLAGVGLSAAETESEVNNVIEKLGAALAAEKTAHNLEKSAREDLQKKMDAANAVALGAFLDQAVKDGKIAATQKDTFAALGFESAKSIIDGLPGKTNIAGSISNSGAGLSAEPKNLDEFEKLSDGDKLAFKNSNPVGYAKLFA